MTSKKKNIQRNTEMTEEKKVRADKRNGENQTGDKREEDMRGEVKEGEWR